MASGGNRKGAGRKKGSNAFLKIKDYFTEEDIEKLVLQVKKKAEAGDVQLLKLLVEQLFGKAPQSIELPEGSSGEIKIKWQR